MVVIYRHGAILISYNITRACQRYCETAESRIPTCVCINSSNIIQHLFPVVHACQPCACREGAEQDGAGGGMVDRKMAEKQEKCSICLESFIDPRILPCCHTYCTKCLERTLEEQVEKKNLITVPGAKECINCPLCKTSSYIPPQGIKGLPIDYKINQDLELEKIKKSFASGKLQDNESCAGCGNEVQILSSKCDDCDGFLCDSCTDNHGRLRIYAKHSIVEISEVTPDMISPRPRVHMCAIHHAQFHSYCKKCEKLICPECVIKTHSKCTGESLVSTISEADRAIADEIIEVEVRAEQTLQSYNRQHEKIIDQERDVVESNHSRELGKHIKANFDHFISELQHHRDMLLAKVEENDNNIKKTVWAKKNYIEIMIKKVKAGLRCVDKARCCKQPAERIIMNVQGCNLLKEVLCTVDSEISPPMPLIYSSKLSRSIISNYGVELNEIQTGDISCEVEGRSFIGSSGKIGQPMVIDVKFKFSVLSIPNIRIQYGQSKQVMDSNAIVVYEDDNNWSVEFVPRCTGEHTVLIIIGGIVVHSSNFDIGGNLKRGDEVQRGPDWCQDQVGNIDADLVIGKVVRVLQSKKAVVVRWRRLINMNSKTNYIMAETGPVLRAEPSENKRFLLNEEDSESGEESVSFVKGMSIDIAML